MKTLVKDGVSIFLFDGSDTVTLQNNQVEVGSPVEMIFADCNSSNCTLHENITQPSDWDANKYNFDGTNWALNDNYQAPKD